MENPIRVLLVEDNPLDVQLLRWMLLQDTHQTFELETADTLSAGIQKIQQGGVDLLLLDLSLPDAHGFDTFHRAVEAVPDLPIIMLTGLDDENLALNAMKAGAQDYLVKGAVDSRGLRKAIRYAVERKRLQEQIVAYSEELSLKNEQLASDLKIAREIQQAFLPQHYPSFPLSADPENSLLHFWHRYFPTGEVGGDFFSILELSDSKAGVIICDVMGHGVSAALVTAMMRALVEELLPQAGEPGPFLNRLNRDLTKILRRARMQTFVSAFYMVADLNKSELSYASAGHPAPIFIRRSEHLAETLSFPSRTPRPALGLFQDSNYQTSSAPLAPEDLLILYTDGLYEVEGANEEYFGQQRLLEAVRRRVNLAPSLLIDEVLGEVRDFSIRSEPDDDICLVGMEVAQTGVEVENPQIREELVRTA